MREQLRRCSRNRWTICQPLPSTTQVHMLQLAQWIHQSARWKFSLSHMSLESQNRNEIIPQRWNHTMKMGSYHGHGIIPWNHTQPISYHGIIPYLSYHTMVWQHQQLVVLVSRGFITQETLKKHEKTWKPGQLETQVLFCRNSSQKLSTEIYKTSKNPGNLEPYLQTITLLNSLLILTNKSYIYS